MIDAKVLCDYINHIGNGKGGGDERMCVGRVEPSKVNLVMQKVREYILELGMGDGA